MCAYVAPILTSAVCSLQKLFFIFYCSQWFAFLGHVKYLLQYWLSKWLAMNTPILHESVCATPPPLPPTHPHIHTYAHTHARTHKRTHEQDRCFQSENYLVVYAMFWVWLRNVNAPHLWHPKIIIFFVCFSFLIKQASNFNWRKEEF